MQSAQNTTAQHDTDDIETLDGYLKKIRAENEVVEPVEAPTPVVVPEPDAPIAEQPSQPKEPEDEAVRPDTPLLSKAERFIADMSSQKDRAETELRGVEAEIISVEEVAVAAEAQARAECEAEIANARDRLERALSRLSGDRDEMLRSLEASKRDLTIIVDGLTAAVEAASAKSRDAE